MNAEFKRLARRYKKAFLGDQYKEIEENNCFLAFWLRSSVVSEALAYSIKQMCFAILMLFL